MSTLTGRSPASSYSGLLQLSGSLDGSLRNIQDGYGITGPIQMSTSALNITGSLYVGGILVNADANEINVLDRTAATGIAEANKALLCDSNRGINMSGAGISGALLFDERYKYNHRGTVLSAMDFSAASGHYQKARLSGAPVVLTFYPTTSGHVSEMTLILEQDTSGSRTVTWPASVKWASGVAPVLSTGSLAVDIFDVCTYDGGNIWYGFFKGKGMA